MPRLLMPCTETGSLETASTGRRRPPSCAARVSRPPPRRSRPGHARRMMQRHESLARRLLPGPDIVLHDRVAAGKAVLITQPLEDPMRRVALPARHVRTRVRLEDRVDDIGEPDKLAPLHRLGPLVTPATPNSSASSSPSRGRCRTVTPLPGGSDPPRQPPDELPH